MAEYTTQKTWEVGETVPAADLNTYLRDDVTHIYDAATMLLDEYDVTTTDISTITFDSISGDYNFLELRVWAQGGSTDSTYLVVRANNDSSSDGYSAIRYYGGTGGIGSYNLYTNASSFIYQILLPDQDEPYYMGGVTCRIYGYTDTNHYTTLDGSLAWTSPSVHGQVFGGVFKSTDAVTRLDISATGGFAVGSHVALYGYR